MSRSLRWGIGLLLIAGLLLGAFFFLPFRSWLPGGTVANIPNREVVNGTLFNRLFPKPQTGEQLVFTQEKRGFSQARLKQGAEVRALLSISDMASSPASRNKFIHSEERLQSWPLVDQGSQASALLVADRFQVKVIGQGNGLDVQQRHELLGSFDLSALAALNPAALQAPAIPVGREALPPGNQAPLRLPLPGRQRQAPQAQPSQARVPQPAANRKPSFFNRFNRANAALEPAA
jgi:hypothetical protein